MRFHAVGREDDQHVTTERPARRQEGRVPSGVAADDPGGELGQVVAILQQGPVLFAHVGLPALIERLHVHVDEALQQPVRAGLLVPDAEQAADLLRTEVGGDILHQAVALLVGQERIGQVVPARVHDLQGDELVGEDGVAQHHLVDGVHLFGRVFGEALHDPRRRPGNRVGDAPHRPPVDDVVLEDVGQLVHEDIAKVVQIAVEGNDHAVAQGLGEAGHARRQKGLDDVGLLEVVVRFEDDDRRLGGQFVAHHRTDVVVALLEIADGAFGEAFKLGLEQQIQVLALHPPGIEVAIADLVLAERIAQLGGDDVLGLERLTRRQQRKRRDTGADHSEPPEAAHPTPVRL